MKSCENALAVEHALALFKGSVLVRTSTSQLPNRHQLGSLLRRRRNDYHSLFGLSCALLLVGLGGDLHGIAVEPPARRRKCPGKPGDVDMLVPPPHLCRQSHQSCKGCGSSWGSCRASCHERLDLCSGQPRIEQNLAMTEPGEGMVLERGEHLAKLA